MPFIFLLLPFVLHSVAAVIVANVLTRISVRMHCAYVVCNVIYPYKCMPTYKYFGYKFNAFHSFNFIFSFLSSRLFVYKAKGLRKRKISRLFGCAVFCAVKALKGSQRNCRLLSKNFFSVCMFHPLPPLRTGLASNNPSQVHIGTR